jgi:hypothetical protein
MLLIVVLLVGACSDDSPDAVAGSTTSVVATAAAAAAASSTTAAATPSTTAARSVGNYNVAPLRSDGQRVTFRVTLADGATAEMSLTPADTAIKTVDPKIDLVRPNGTPAGGGTIHTVRADDATFTSFCSSALGGKCKPSSTQDLAEGNELETFALASGETTSRVVFGPWAIFVNGRDVADAFTFRNGPDGFPLVSARAAGWSTSAPTLSVETAGGARYLLRSDPSGTCPPADSRTHCDRGLSIQPLATSPDASVRRTV